MALSLPPTLPPPPTPITKTPIKTKPKTQIQTLESFLSTSLQSPHLPLPHLLPLLSLSLKSNLILSPLILPNLLSSLPPPLLLPLFLSLPSPPPSLFPFNLSLSLLSRSSSHLPTLRLYSLLRSLPLPLLPDPFTLPPVLRSASLLPSLSAVLDAHSLSLKTNLFSHLIVRTALVNAYCSLRLPAPARLIFDRTHLKDTILYNTLIAGLAKCGDFASALEVFNEMPNKNLSSFNTVIDVHCRTGNVGTAREVFDGMGIRDLISWNTMISGYMRVGDFDEVRTLFDRMPERNVVSWNVAIGCFVNGRMFAEGLELFRSMQESSSGVEPNEVTLVHVLVACAHLGALDLGRWVEGYIYRRGIEMDLFVTTALVDMYGKCGSSDDARRIFDRGATTRRDAFLCNTMIEIYAMHGQAAEAFEVFDDMREEGIRPNDVTFVGLLKACAHVGSVRIGERYFEMMEREFGLMPKVEHFGCMVDLLGRAGQMDEAYKLILSMPMGPSPVIWASLLSSCRIHGNVELAEEVAPLLIELEPESCGNYVLLSNVYSKADRWDDAAKVRKEMKEKGVLKKPGCSLIEVNNRVNEFFAGDRDHPQCGEIYEMLDRTVARLKEEGYEPCTSSALHDVGRDGREKALIHHSEKLALAFGLISSEEGSRIRIVKNLRVCDDCHVFLKLASKCYGREVVVRDCHRFHHFKDGSCSCLDYW